MSNKKLSTIKTLIVLAAPLYLAACGQNPGEPTANVESQGDAVVKSTLVLGKVGALSKVASINLRKVYFTATSTALDTVRDSATVSGNAQITVPMLFTLKPLRTWTVSAKSMDVKDSVVHQGQSASFYVKPADTVSVNLSLDSRFTMYEARFNALPDSISSSVSGTGKDKLNLNRVVLKVDGVVRYDSTLATGYFPANQAVNIFFDYVTTGTHTVVLEAYGKMNNYTGMLYTGNASITAGAGIDVTQAVTLGWVGPTTGNGKLTVTLGKVGKVIVNGALPGAVIL